MDVRFACSQLEAMEADGTCSGKYSVAIAAKFRWVMNFIRAASNEHDFRAMRSLKFEKLKGNRSHEHSFRLNSQWRLIVEIENQSGGNIIVVTGIEDYH